MATLCFMVSLLHMFHVSNTVRVPYQTIFGQYGQHPVSEETMINILHLKTASWHQNGTELSVIVCFYLENVEKERYTNQ